MSQFTRAGRPH